MRMREIIILHLRSKPVLSRPHHSNPLSVFLFRLQAIIIIAIITILLEENMIREI
jgi:hypothetical protein